MNHFYQQLASALRKRLEIISDRVSYSRDADAHLHQLKRVSEQICELKVLLPQPVDPQLAHYLERASYEKALAFIDAQLKKAQ